MSGSVPAWAIAVQFVVAGTVLGLIGLQVGLANPGASARRDEVRRSGTGWLLAWSAALAAVGLVNGMLLLTTDPGIYRALVAVRFATIGAGIVLALPVLGSATGQRRPTVLTVCAATWYGMLLVLLVTTKLIVVEATPDALPLYGPLAGIVHLAPLALVAVCAGLAVRHAPMTAMTALLTVTGFIGALLLIVSTIPPPTVLSELARGVWALPVVAGLQVLVSVRVRGVRRAAARRAQMRDALAQLSEAGWKVPAERVEDGILELAQQAARSVLGDLPVRTRLNSADDGSSAIELYAEDADGCVDTFLLDVSRVANEVRERRSLTHRLGHAAQVDLLTGLPSRAALEEFLSAEATTYDDVAVLVVDIEALNRVNDRHGRRVGDSVLLHVARHLSTQLPGTFIARVESDEFAAILTDAPTIDELRDLAHHLRDSWGEVPGAIRSRLTVGAARGNGSDGPTIVRHAEVAMSHARRTHAGLAYFDDRMRAREAEHETMYADLEAAVTDGKIVAHFQPLADPASLEIVGLETLARWRDGDELRAPASWLNLAEDTGLIVEIGQQMLSAARAAMERYGLPVAVNVAACQLDDPDVVAKIEQGWGTDAWDRLTIEVTESALLHDVPQVHAALSVLAERGVRIALDDFGTGYNSMSRLGSLPVHVLKIDQSLVQQIGTDEGRAVVRAIVDLARAHHLEVVAEGVEHRSQLAALLSVGVDMVQGHLIGRPNADGPVRTGAAPTQRGDAELGVTA